MPQEKAYSSPINVLATGPVRALALTRPMFRGPNKSRLTGCSLVVWTIKFFHNVTNQDPLSEQCGQWKTDVFHRNTPFVKKQGRMRPNLRKSHAIWSPSNECLRYEDEDKFIPPTACRPSEKCKFKEERKKVVPLFITSLLCIWTRVRSSGSRHAAATYKSQKKNQPLFELSQYI